MFKKFILALLCVFALATAWQAGNCEDKVMKEAIAEAEIKIKASMHETMYTLKKALHCMKEEDGRDTKIGLSLFGQDTAHKVYVHRFIYRHTTSGDYFLLSNNVIYQKSITDSRKLPYDGVPAELHEL